MALGSDGKPIPIVKLPPSPVMPTQETSLGYGGALDSVDSDGSPAESVMADAAKDTVFDSDSTPAETIKDGPKFHRFGCLSPELRDKIYELALTPKRGRICRPQADSYYKCGRDLKALDTSLFLVNRKFGREARETLYRVATVHLPMEKKPSIGYVLADRDAVVLCQAKQVSIDIGMRSRLQEYNYNGESSVAYAVKKLIPLLRIAEVAGAGGVKELVLRFESRYAKAAHSSLKNQIRTFAEAFEADAKKRVGVKVSYADRINYAHKWLKEEDPDSWSPNRDRGPDRERELVAWAYLAERQAEWYGAWGDSDWTASDADEEDQDLATGGGIDGEVASDHELENLGPAAGGSGRASAASHADEDDQDLASDAWGGGGW